MNRRTLLASILALPLSTLPASAAIYDSNWTTVENKLGKRVQYSHALAADLWTIHGISARQLFKNMYGTSFKITKKLDKTLPVAWFAIETNHKADGIFIWYQKLTAAPPSIIQHKVERSLQTNQRRYVALKSAVVG
jgi:hypothetical protein